MTIFKSSDQNCGQINHNGYNLIRPIIVQVGGVKIPRTKGSKNKKTLLKEKVSHKTSGVVVEKDLPEIPNPELKHRLAFRLFTLEKKVHDDFIKHITQFGDPKLYESYIVNEIMVRYIDGKIKVSKPDKERLYDYMSVYGTVGFEPGTVTEEMDDFDLKSANKLIHKKSNSFIQFQYPIVVDPEVKLSMLGKVDSISYLINECLKLYVLGELKIDTRDFKIKEWEPEYRYTIKKKRKSED